MKDKVLIITVILTIGCLVYAVKASQRVNQNQAIIEVERYKRMEAEEALQKAQSKNVSLVNELTNVRNQLQGIQTILEKEKVASANFKEELERVSDSNESLKIKIKNALSVNTDTVQDN